MQSVKQIDFLQGIRIVWPNLAYSCDKSGRGAGAENFASRAAQAVELTRRVQGRPRVAAPIDGQAQRPAPTSQQWVAA